VRRVLCLDEASPASLVPLKKLLQAGPDPCLLGASPTLMSAYTVHSYRVKIVVSTNAWGTAMSELSADNRDWFAQNAVVYEVREPLYEPGQARGCSDALCCRLRVASCTPRRSVRCRTLLRRQVAGGCLEATSPLKEGRWSSNPWKLHRT